MNRSVIFLDLLRLTLNGLFNGWQAEQRLCVGDSAPYRFRCLSSEQMAERARCTVAANCSINYIISNTLLPVSFSCKQKTCLMFSLCMIHPTSSRIIICHQINITLFVIESWKYSFSKYKSFQPHSSKNERLFFFYRKQSWRKEKDDWLKGIVRAKQQKRKKMLSAWNKAEEEGWKQMQRGIQQWINIRPAVQCCRDMSIIKPAATEEILLHTW